jgi:hypothetical protein
MSPRLTRCMRTRWLRQGQMIDGQEEGESSEQRRCPHCQSHRVKSVLRYREQESLCCRDCGGLFNRPGRDTRALYDQSYYEAVYVPRRDEQLSRSQRELEVIRQFVPTGAVLDLDVVPVFSYWRRTKPASSTVSVQMSARMDFASRETIWAMELPWFICHSSACQSESSRSLH